MAAEGKGARTRRPSPQAINQFLQDDLLGQGVTYDQPDREVKLRTLLDRAAENVGERFKDKPLVEAAIRDTLSGVYGSLGEATNARAHFDRALAIYKQRLSPDDPTFLGFRSGEVCLLQYEGRNRESQELAEQLLPILRRVFGPTNGPTLGIMQDLAIAYRCQRKLTEAQKLIEEVISLRRRDTGAESRVSLDCMLELAMIHLLQGRLVEAQKLAEEVMSVSRRVFDSPQQFTRLYALQSSTKPTFARASSPRRRNLWEGQISDLRGVL